MSNDHFPHLPDGLGGTLANLITAIKNSPGLNIDIYVLVNQLKIETENTKLKATVNSLLTIVGNIDKTIYDSIIRDTKYEELMKWVGLR